jgi:hypothetical protein
MSPYAMNRPMSRGATNGVDWYVTLLFFVAMIGGVGWCWRQHPVAGFASMFVAVFLGKWLSALRWCCQGCRKFTAKPEHIPIDGETKPYCPKCAAVRR